MGVGYTIFGVYFMCGYVIGCKEVGCLFRTTPNLPICQARPAINYLHMSDNRLSIEWKYPAPRTGFKGLVDKLVGPGATKAELFLQFSFAIFMGLGMLYYGYTRTAWNGWQIAVTSYLMFDICGGIATNATNAAKRWWHRQDRLHIKNDAIFVSAHFYMPFLITLAFFPSDWNFFFVTYVYLLIGGLCIALSPLYLRRPVAFLAYVGALFISFTISVPPGLLWFIPLFYLKIFLAHLPPEAPIQSSQ